MENWAYMMIFIFTILVMGRNLFLLLTSLLSPEPKKYTLPYPELILFGIAISYFLTYLIK